MTTAPPETLDMETFSPAGAVVDAAVLVAVVKYGDTAARVITSEAADAIAREARPPPRP